MLYSKSARLYMTGEKKKLKNSSTVQGTYTYLKLKLYTHRQMKMKYILAEINEKHFNFS